MATGETFTLDNPFKACIEAPTREIAWKKPWVVSVLWDNAGVGRFDDEFSYVIKGETHNSPSNLEAYGGSLTGIVGVYRDPLGTGKGARLIGGMYGFCVGPRDYAGPLKPRLHPRRLLDGVIEGVKDGGNKSGVPTVGGALYFDPSYLGKCLVFVGAVGLLPKEIKGEPGAEKAARPGDLIVTCGGRVGQDGIHGVTASSEVVVPGHPGRPCPDRRPLHPEEHARFPPGGPGPGPHHLHHRLRRRRAVVGGGRIGARWPAAARSSWRRCP